MSGSTALYRYFDDKGRLLYVGITEHLAGRERGHIKLSFWMGLVASSTVERHPGRTEALVAEREAIKTECPLFNRQYNDTTAARGRARAYLEEIGRMDLYDPRRYAGNVPLGELEMRHRRRQGRVPPPRLPAQDDPDIRINPVRRDQVILIFIPALQDNELSFAARGLLAFILSLPRSFEVTTEWLATQRPNGGEDIGAALSELEACGYLQNGVISDGKHRQAPAGAA